MGKQENALKKIFTMRGMGQVLTVTVGLIILCIVFGILNPTFFSGRNIGNLLRQVAPILIIGVGQAYVMITGNIDLSIGSVGRYELYGISYYDDKRNESMACSYYYISALSYNWCN